MRDRIAEVFPETAAYLKNYVHDSTPWCGLAVAYASAESGYRPGSSVPPTPINSSGHRLGRTGELLFTEPQVGCVVVLKRSGGGHVSLYEGSSNGSLRLRGGNQSDAVNVSTFDKADVIAYRWPSSAAAPLPPTDPASMPLIKLDRRVPQSLKRNACLAVWRLMVNLDQPQTREPENFKLKIP